jgi:hypothetical protein
MRPKTNLEWESSIGASQSRRSAMYLAYNQDNGKRNASLSASRHDDDSVGTQIHRATVTVPNTENKPSASKTGL